MPIAIEVTAEPIEVMAEPIEVTAGGTLDLQDQCERNPLCLRGFRHHNKGGRCRTTSRKACVACSNRRVIDPDSNGRCRDCAGTRKDHCWQPAKFPEWANAQVGKCNECRRKEAAQGAARPLSRVHQCHGG